MAAALKHIGIVRERSVRSRRSSGEECHEDSLAVDSHGLPFESEIPGGGVTDCFAAPDLIARSPDAQAIVADKGYDSGYIQEQIIKKGARSVIPRKRNSLKDNADID